MEEEINDKALTVLIGFTPVQLGDDECSPNSPYANLLKTEKSTMTYDECIQFAKDYRLDVDEITKKCNEVKEMRNDYHNAVEGYWEGTEEELNQRLMDLFPYEEIIKFVY